jgi:hypothetical protein
MRLLVLCPAILCLLHPPVISLCNLFVSRVTTLSLFRSLTHSLTHSLTLSLFECHVMSCYACAGGKDSLVAWHLSEEAGHPADIFHVCEGREKFEKDTRMHNIAKKIGKDINLGNNGYNYNYSYTVAFVCSIPFILCICIIILHTGIHQYISVVMMCWHCVLYHLI